MAKVKANNLNMYYETHGKGFPLVMIMGLSANIYWWDSPFLEELARHFQILIFDNRGVGRSDDPQVDFSIKNQFSRRNEVPAGTRLILKKLNISMPKKILSIEKQA